MFGALSIVPAVGRGIAMVTPVPWSYYLLGANHLPLIAYVHDNPKGRLKVTPLLANTHIPCQAQTAVVLKEPSGGTPRWDQNLEVLDPGSTGAFA